MKFSVALCTFNGEKYLKEQLESILSQTLSIDEIIICDDCSTDGTAGIIESWMYKYPDLIQFYNNKQSLGTIKNFEKAISKTKGDLIFLSDQDDVWCHNKVEIMSRFFKENNNCKLLFSDGKLIDDTGASLNSTLWEKWGFDLIIRKSWFNNENAFKDLIINHNKITGATVCFHNSLKKNVLPIEIPFGYWHDVWLGIHAAAQNGLMFLDQQLISYRIHEKQQVGISVEIDNSIRDKSNKDAIHSSLFYKNIRKLYPYQKNNIPVIVGQNLWIRAVNKIKRIFFI